MPRQDFILPLIGYLILMFISVVIPYSRRQAYLVDDVEDDTPHSTVETLLLYARAFIFTVFESPLLRFVMLGMCCMQIYHYQLDIAFNAKFNEPQFYFTEALALSDPETVPRYLRLGSPYLSESYIVETTRSHGIATHKAYIYAVLPSSTMSTDAADNASPEPIHVFIKRKTDEVPVQADESEEPEDIIGLFDASDTISATTQAEFEKAGYVLEPPFYLIEEGLTALPNPQLKILIIMATIIAILQVGWFLRYWQKRRALQDAQ